MMNESLKKLLEKSKNVLEAKRKILKRKICIKKQPVEYWKRLELSCKKMSTLTLTKSEYRKKN